MERLEIEPSPSSLLLPDIPTFIRSKEVQQQQQQQWQRLTDVTRRRALFAATATAISSAATTNIAAADFTIVNSNTEMRRLEERMRADNINLIQPPFSISTIPSSTTNANNNNLVVYPSFLLGTWNVTQTLVAVSTPLGLQYAGGPNGIVSIGEQSIRQAKSRLFQPVSLQLRYVPVATTAAPTADIAGGVVEDRLFNTQQRFNSFAGKNVVANVVYEEPRRGGGGTAAATTVAGKGGATLSSSSVHPIDPIAPITTTTTTVTYFKGPAAQKTFVTAHHDASSAVATFGTYCGQTADTPKTWTGFECQRSLFALTNANTAPPIPTDSELLFSFAVDCRDLNHVTGRLRIVGYLNPSTDTLYFAARNRAVTIQDYTLDLLKVV
jgi:hypothetical protein